MKVSAIYFCRNPQANQKEGAPNRVPYDPKYAVFSNYTHDILVLPKGIKTPRGFKRIALSPEHLFQALKHAPNKRLFNAIMRARTKRTRLPSPNNAKKMGRGSRKTGIGRLSPRDLRWWDANRFPIMLNVLRLRVAQHPNVKKLLLSTGDAELIENAPWDSFWGIGRNGKGKNMLGKAWMIVRSELIRAQPGRDPNTVYKTELDVM
jgi:ribA/ribD-fused uncharacterized protein